MVTSYIGANRRIRSFSLLISVLSVCSATAVAEEPEFATRAPFSIGETVSFHSRVLGEPRTLNVYLPRSYSTDPQQSYPVIYLLDGSADEDFVHISGLVQFGSFSWIRQLPESILIGIGNVDRQRDFTFPSDNRQDNEELPTSGGSAAFIEFIEQELQPRVESTWRVTNQRTLIGQSLGGLLATEILFSQPQLFDHYIVISPSLWWDDESLLRATPVVPTEPVAVYVGVGKEGEVMERVGRALYDKISSQAHANVEVHFRFFEQLDHGDTLHLAVYDAFDRLFSQQSE